MHWTATKTLGAVLLLHLLGSGLAINSTLCRSCSSTGPQTESLVVGEFTNWKYWTLHTAYSSINASLYTHLIYKNALDPTGAKCTLTQDWLDLHQQFGNSTLGDDSNDPYQGGFNQLRRLKLANPHMKVLLAIGGYDLSSDLSVTAANATLRAQLVSSCVGIMNQYGFDGINFVWEYPSTVAKAGNVYSPSDRANLVTLAGEFRSALSFGKLFTLSVAYWESVVNVRYDMLALDRYVDWFNVNAFYYWGTGNSAIGHASNLYPSSSNLTHSASVVNTINVALSLGVAPCKIVLGVPAFGFEWRLANPPTAVSFPELYDTGVSTLLSAGADAGSYIDRDFETMTPANGWVEVWDPTAQASVLYNSTSQLLVTYDSTRAAALKVKWAVDHGLGGIILQDLNGDMQNNRLGTVILSTLKANRPCALTATTAATQSSTPAATPAPTSSGRPMFTTLGPLLQTTSKALPLNWKLAAVVSLIFSLLL